MQLFAFFVQPVSPIACRVIDDGLTVSELKDLRTIYYYPINKQGMSWLVQIVMNDSNYDRHQFLTEKERARVSAGLI